MLNTAAHAVPTTSEMKKKNGSAASLSLSLHSFQDKNFIAFSSIHLRPVDIMSLNDIALVSNTNAF